MDERRQARKTKLWPSHLAHQAKKRKSQPKRQPKERYDANSLRHAIKYAIQAANRVREKENLPLIPDWKPNQLRHTAATILRREFGLEVSRCILGHSSPETTLVYAEADWAKASDAMRKMG
jgi:integrase